MAESILSQLNLSILRGQKEIVVPQSTYNFNKGFILVGSDDVKLDFSLSKVSGEGCVIDIKGKNTTVKNCCFATTEEKEWAIRVEGEARFENVTFACGCGVLCLDKSKVSFVKCVFMGESGICSGGDCKLDVQNCTFATQNEAITVVDDENEEVIIVNNSIKRCGSGIRLVGRVSAKIENNYFLTQNEAIKIAPSIFKGGQGAKKVTIKNNLFDECATNTQTIVIEAEKKEGYSHKTIEVSENAFSQKKGGVLSAFGVEELSFKENRVQTNGESTVENSIINGIKA